MDRISKLNSQISLNPCAQPAKVSVELLENGKIGVISFNSPKDLNVLSA